MPSPFEKLDFQKALQLMVDLWTDDDEKNFELYKGNHWMNGEGWKGPQVEGTDRVSQTIKRGIERDFTSKNVIRAVVKRHRRGIVGREPGWTISVRRELPKVKNEAGEMVEGEPTAAEQKLIDEANALLLAWWNEHRALREFRKAVTNLLLARRGPLRLYIPPASLVKKEGARPFLPQLKPEEAVKVIFLLAPSPKDATVIVDQESMRRASLYFYKTTDGKQKIELSYLDDDGQTVFRVLDHEGPGLFQRAATTARQLLGMNDGDARNRWKYPLNGKLFAFEMETEALITQQSRENQALVAKGLTGLSHCMDLSGFRERVYFNAQPPGRKILVDDPNHPGQKIEAYVDGIMPIGPNTRGFITGIPVRDKNPDGSTTTRLSTPTVVDTDPIPVKSFEDTMEIGARNILEEADQLHVQIAGDSAASGESRKQARDEYSKSLKETKPEVDYVGSEIGEAVLSLIAILSGQSGRFDGLRVSLNSQIDPGPMSSDDRRMIIEEKKERLRSREDAMEQVGVDDPDAMKAKIREEEAEEPPAVDPNQQTGNIDDKGGDQS